MRNTKNRLRAGLTITHETEFLEHPIMSFPNGSIEEYLSAIKRTLTNATEEYPRTWAVRVDLRLPSGEQYDSRVISRFTDSLKAKISADLTQKEKGGQRVHPCKLRYIWVREKKSSEQSHYHLLLLFNKDSYSRLGRYDASKGNMACRIKSAWASALKIDVREVDRLVYFPDNHTYYLNRNGDLYIDEFDNLFYRVSYFAKVDTKHYGNRERCFGYSQR